MNKYLYIIAFILGLICSFGQPPFNYVLSSLCSIALFFYFLTIINKNKEIFWFSFSFGYGYYIYSQHWFNESLLAYGDKFLWLLPFGLLLIPAFFAFYFAFVGFLVAKVGKGNIFISALIWLGVEFIRSYGYIELPWLLVGYVWSDANILSQNAALFGIWGLSFLTIIWVGAIYTIMLMLKDLCVTKLSKQKTSPNNKYNFSTVSIAAFSFILCYFYGIYHLNAPLTSQTTKVRIVQANIDQNIYSRINNSYENLLKNIDLSKNEGEIDYIIWPEGSHEYDLHPQLLDLLKDTAPKHGALIFSASRVQNNPLSHWNSLFVINRDGKIIDFYDKIHLVPLGEFIPLRSLLPFINKITPGSIDYNRGHIVQPIKTTPPFLPTICYEDAFPETSSQFFTWIVNITNDGWFGTSIGPHQHLAIAKFRSIELGVPMVRAALTGISAIIDSFGRIVKTIPLLTEGIIDAQLPAYITDFTIYHFYGNYSLIILILLMFGLEKLLNHRSK